MTTVPIEYDASLSNTGVHVVPALMVFHIPPDAAATYQIFLSLGWTARSLMRPDVSAGPIGRRRSPANGPPAPSPRPPVESSAVPRDVESVRVNGARVVS